MKFIKEFKVFEQKKLDKYDEIMGKLLHLYGSIPLEKEKASIVISKIIHNTIGKYYTLGDDVNIRHQADHDKVRFKDYFDSLLKSKDSRGHNFEGTLAGLYNGELSERGEKWDMTIDDKTWSVKFIDNPSKAPEIGSFNNVIKNAGLEEQVKEVGGLTRLFRSNETELKEKAFDVISEGITGGWIIAFPVKSKENDNINIQVNVLSVDVMRELLTVDGLSVAPKAGMKSLFTLALSAKFKYKNSINKSVIKVPKLSIDELKEILGSDKEWAQSVFGKYGYKIRPDVLGYIKSNSDEVANRLLKFKDI